LRDAHERICRFLTANKYAPLLYHPWFVGKFRDVVEAQLEEFQRLYGRAPSHLDGHQHMHLASNVVLHGILPAGTKVRRSFSFGRGEKSLVNRWYRGLLDCWLARRHRLTDYFFALSSNLSQDRFERIITLAKAANVELMVHPDIAKEYEFLMSDRYREAVCRVRLAAFDAL
jgi:chitin disaccharide deacetylase